MKIFNIKIQNLLFLLVVSGFIFSCQSTQYRHNEKARKDHAKEILNKKYYGSAVSRLANDPELSIYMKEYLKKTSLKKDYRNVVKTLLETSHANHYDPIFLMAVIKTESEFRAGVIGSAGEIGLMQIKPDTAKWICQKKGFAWKGNNALKDPHYNIQVGALYFKYLKKSLNSRASHYIAAYNTGPAGLNRWPASIEKHPYLSRVLNNYLSIYGDLEKIKLERVALAKL